MQNNFSRFDSDMFTQCKSVNFSLKSLAIKANKGILFQLNAQAPEKPRFVTNDVRANLNNPHKRSGPNFKAFVMSTVENNQEHNRTGPQNFSALFLGSVEIPMF